MQHALIRQRQASLITAQAVAKQDAGAKQAPSPPGTEVGIGRGGTNYGHAKEGNHREAVCTVTCSETGARLVSIYLGISVWQFALRARPAPV
jgi:hypothetical protein